MKKRVVLLILAAVLLLACVMSGCGKKQPPKEPTAEELMAALIQEQEAEFTKAITALFTADAETWTYYNLDPHEFAYMKESGEYGDISEEVIAENYKKGLQAFYESNEETYGKNFSVSVSSSTSEVATNEELSKLKANIVEGDPHYADANIEAFSILTADITLSGDISTEVLVEDYPFIKIDGRWYIGVGGFNSAEDVRFFLEDNQ